MSKSNIEDGVSISTSRSGCVLGLILSILNFPQFFKLYNDGKKFSYVDDGRISIDQLSKNQRTAYSDFTLKRNRH